MTIRKTLLFAFLCVGLLPACLLAGLAFVQARDVVRAEIESNLKIQAEGIADYTDKLIFERLLNAVSWSRLSALQDVQGGDSERRSLFLSDLHSGYKDFYLDFSCVDDDGRVLSSSDASQIGRLVAKQPTWLRVSLFGADVELEAPTQENAGSLLMRTSLTSASAGEAGRSGGGQLLLNFDWSELYDALDQASSGRGRAIVILDSEGRLIAASKDLRGRGLFFSRALADWRALASVKNAKSANNATLRSGAPLIDSDVIVGAARSRGYEKFAGFGWTTLVVESADQAFAPVHRMAGIFAGLLVVSAFLIFLMSSWVSRKIARPIIGLTAFTRNYLRHKVLQAPSVVVGGGEVRELTESFVQMVRDIDQSQQNLMRASKLAVVGEMSALIAHEVRTPLGILRSSAQMLQRETGISAEGRELAGFIDSESERLNRLVSGMLDAARPRPPAYSDVDVHGLIDKSIGLLGGLVQKKGVLITQSLRAEDPLIECDEEQMTQVLLNLLMNGLQILDHGGRIDVATRSDEANVFIEMADDGPGIDPDERSRVFQAFFFKREGGFGLGLAVVQQIVVAHGGDVEATESPLGGALFRVRLPRRQSGGV